MDEWMRLKAEGVTLFKLQSHTSPDHRVSMFTWTKKNPRGHISLLLSDVQLA
jgi:hypothetical protein